MTTTPRHFAAIFFCTIFLSSGCSLGPDYVRPTVDLPENFRIQSAPQNPAESVSLTWWKGLGDEKLSSLIERALEHNNDLLRATATVERYFALYGLERSAYFPQLDGTASGTRQRSAQIEQFPGLGKTIDTYRSLLSLSWELDVWGRIRRISEAARANLLSSEAIRRGVIITLVSTVAQTYVELRELDRELDLSRETLESRRESLKLARTRFEGGLTSELDVRQAEAEVATTEVSIPELERLVAQKENELRVLIGDFSGQLDRGKPIGELVSTTAVPSGLPADLLNNRPDLIAAEQGLIAANAQIGAARAEFFPRIALTGAFGYSSLELNELFEGPSRTWRWGTSISMPVLSGGRVLNQVRAANSAKEEALFGYRSAVQSAFREVEDALVGNQKSREQREARERQVSVLDRYMQLAKTAYEGGASGYLDVLDAQRNLFNAQIQLVRAQSDNVLALIALYRSLGGGWVTEADKMTALPAAEQPEIPLFIP